MYSTCIFLVISRWLLNLHLIGCLARICNTAFPFIQTFLIGTDSVDFNTTLLPVQSFFIVWLSLYISFTSSWDRKRLRSMCSTMKIKLYMKWKWLFFRGHSFWVWLGATFVSTTKLHKIFYWLYWLLHQLKPPKWPQQVSQTRQTYSDKQTFKVNVRRETDNK